jgi:hypothetical protein
MRRSSTRVTDPHVAARMGLPPVEPWFYGIGSLDEAITTAPSPSWCVGASCFDAWQHCLLFFC